MVISCRFKGWIIQFQFHGSPSSFAAKAPQLDWSPEPNRNVSTNASIDQTLARYKPVI